MDQNNKRFEKTEAILDHYGFAAQQEKLVEECEELIEAAEGEDYDVFIERLADVRIIIEQVKLALDDDQQEQYEAAIVDRLSSSADCIDGDSDDEPF